MGGLDTLVARLYGRWRKDAGRDTFHVLEQARLAAEASHSDSGPVHFPDGDEALVRVRGVSKPYEGYYRWFVEWQGIRLLIADPQGRRDALPSVIVELGSIALMELGHVQAWSMVNELLRSLGFECGRNIPSRSDHCTDHAGRSVKDFMTPFVQDRCIRLARQWHMHGEGLVRNGETGFEVGGGEGIKLRVYDKLAELAAKNGPESQKKLELLKAHRWGGDVPKSATRVEFQLRREHLREIFNVESVEDLFAALPRIHDYLTKAWFRLTEDDPDRDNRNQGRAATSELWAEVQHAFMQWAGPQGTEERPRLRPAISVDALTRQASGVIKSIIARSVESVPNVAAMLRGWADQLTAGGEAFAEEIGVGMFGAEWREGMFRRRGKIRARIGAFDDGSPTLAPF